VHGTNTVKFTKKGSFLSLWDHTVAMGLQAYMWARLQIVCKFRKKILARASGNFDEPK
jgi:hypothetical protein